ncbi:Lpg1974 family pore-forming outer membrane protein [Mesorhizobium sp. M1396]|uniref:Lpg1974 family pore-forming outer membrane protein n=1 Tax=Mesorhizobium sp. M1396 TaxID=2957095 RepID=UPI0033350CA8
MRNHVSGKLLATVAASAASVTSIGVVAAHAADAQVTDPAVVDSRIKIAFEGAVYQSNVDKVGDTSDKLGSGSDFGDLYGSVALTKQISPDVDWRIAGAFHAGQDNDFNLDATVPGGVVGLSFGNSYNFQTLDFDVGKHVQVQSADIRFFGGVRLLHSKEELNFNVSATPDDPTDKGGNVDKLGSSEFYGIGPRLGAEVYYPLSETWGLTGAVSGSAMWGRRTDKISFHVHEDDPSDPTPDPDVDVSESEHSSEVVTNVDLSGGVTFKPWENTTFTAGYRVEQWHNLLLLSDKSTQTFHGPFLRLEVKM